MNGSQGLQRRTKRLRRAGVEVEVRKSGHLRLFCPDGSYVTTGASPSCTRANKELASA